MCLVEWDGILLLVWFCWQDQAGIWAFSQRWAPWQLWLMLLSPPALILSALLVPFSCLAYFRRQLLSKKASISPSRTTWPTQPWSAPQSGCVLCLICGGMKLHAEFRHLFCHVFHPWAVQGCFTSLLGTHPTWLMGGSPTMGTMGCRRSWSDHSPPEMPLTAF